MTASGMPSAKGVALDAWVAAHGPLSPQEAILLGLEVCTTASTMSPATLRRRAGSLSVSGVEHGQDGWRWTAPESSADVGAVKEPDVVERIGALMFHAVTGDRPLGSFLGEGEVRAALGAARPDIPPGVAHVVARALCARRHGYLLARLARDLRQSAGVDYSGRPRRLWVGLLAGAVAILAGGLTIWWGLVPSEPPINATGFTDAEVVLSDLVMEHAQGLSLTDEHTAAIQTYQALMRLMDTRLDIDDGRRDQILAYESWARTLRGDWFTAEQLLSFRRPMFEAHFGKDHPYTRAATLHLAAALAARGATADAARLRASVTMSSTSPLAGFGVPAPDGQGSYSVAAGVLAHVEPNVPEREGFRYVNRGEFAAPLTIVQRLMADRGWRLRVASATDCRTELIVGNVPRKLAVSLVHDAAGHAQVHVEGVQPPIRLSGGSLGLTHLTISGDRTGRVTAVLGQAMASGAVDTAAPLPVPPYVFAYGSRSAAGCAVAWLELTVPTMPNGSIDRPFTR